MVTDTLVSIGVIAGVFGIKGEFKVDSLTDYDDRFDIGNEIYLGAEKVEIIRSRKINPRRFILGLSSINDRSEAMGIPSGTLLGIPENQLKQLPEGEHYRFQLIGFEVWSFEKTRIGYVSEIIETGANDVFVVPTTENTELLVPTTPEMVKIDAGNKLIFVHMIEEI